MRAVVGVIIAVIAMAVGVLALSLAPWFVFGVDAVLEPGTFVSTPIDTTYAIVIGVLGALGGGWICATVAKSRLAVIVVAALAFAGGIGNHMAQHHKPDPGPRPAGLSVMDAVARRKEPDWFTLLMPCLGVATILIGGRRARRR